MASFGGGFGGGFGDGFGDDALFGLGEADSVVPDSDDEGGFDLDRDDISNVPSQKPGADSFDMSGLGGALPDGGLGGIPGMPPGMEDIDPSVLQEMAGLMQGGMPDPNKLRALMKKNPALKDMVQGMMGGGMGGMGDMMAGMGMGDMMGGMGRGAGGMGGMGPPGGGRADSQRARLQERLRQKREAGEVNIPEVKKSGGKAGSSGATSATADAGDDDDWLDGAAAIPSGSAGGKKAGGGKKKGGKKKGKKK